MAEIWMAAAEARPLALAGGLADVLRALPEAMARAGHSVRRFLPAYGFIDRDGFDREGPAIPVPLGPERVPVGFLSRREPGGVVTTLVESEELFGRDQIYGPPGREYPDNARRFTLFARAVCERARAADPRPAILHVHDWHAALVPLLLKQTGGWGGAAPKSVLTIHNLAHQGHFDPRESEWMAFPDRVLGDLFTPEGIEFHGGFNVLKTGIVYADAVTTVSPTYAKEILTEGFGCSLDPLLRHHAGKLTGILNGADYEVWDPGRDPHLPRTYGPDSLAAKAEARGVLREKFHLPASDRPMAGVVSRLAHQKGIDVAIRAAWEFAEGGPDLVVLGSGDPKEVDELERLRAAHPDRVGVYIGYNETLAHLVVAGSDVILIPSRYEPCGLVQMHAMRYGTPPVATRTGGLADTVRDESEHPGRGNGFLLPELSPGGIASALERALALRRDGAAWSALQRRAMAEDFSWDRAAVKYSALYSRL